MKKFRNILSLALVFIMLIGLMPMNVFADNMNTPVSDGAPTLEKEDDRNNDPGSNQGVDENAKKTAEDTVKGLKNISDADRQTALDAIKVATKQADLDAAVNKATEADTKALNDAKAKAKKDVEDLANKDEAIKAIEAANTVADVKAAVTKAQEDAKKAAEDKDKEKEKKEEEKKELAKAKKTAKDAVDKLANLSDADKKTFKDKIDKAANKEAVEAILNEAKAPKKGAFTIDTGYTPYGNIEVNKSTADAKEQVTVTVKPKYGYVVSRVYFRVNGTSVDQTINNYYNSYYYDRYPGYYYGDSYYDYYRYYDEYRNSRYYFKHYSNYHEFLRYEYRDHYLNYKYWNDRYDDDDYWYYYKRNGYRPWYYGRIYDNSLYNTSDTFQMPSGDITVFVEFTDWSYYDDDYYYYRYYRNKKDNYYERQKKADEKAKEEKPAEEKPAKVYQESATITIGSNVFEQVNKNVLTKHEMDVTAYINNGRVMLPLRYVAEALGLQVTWIAETKTVVIWDLAQRVEIPIKTKNIIVNGVTYTSDVKPEIKSGRTMLPIANVARALGLIDGSDIVWDPIMKQVRVTRTITSK